MARRVICTREGQATNRSSLAKNREGFPTASDPSLEHSKRTRIGPLPLGMAQIRHGSPIAALEGV
jgi:hypothetical protein